MYKAPRSYPHLLVFLIENSESRLMVSKPRATAEALERMVSAFTSGRADGITSEVKHMMCCPENYDCTFNLWSREKGVSQLFSASRIRPFWI